MVLIEHDPLPTVDMGTSNTNFIDTLPDEVLSIVFGFVFHARALAKVCSRWRRVYKNSVKRPKEQILRQIYNGYPVTLEWHFDTDSVITTQDNCLLAVDSNGDIAVMEFGRSLKHIRWYIRSYMATEIYYIDTQNEHVFLSLPKPIHTPYSREITHFTTRDDMTVWIENFHLLLFSAPGGKKCVWNLFKGLTPDDGDFSAENVTLYTTLTHAVVHINGLNICCIAELKTSGSISFERYDKHVCISTTKTHIYNSRTTLMLQKHADDMKRLYTDDESRVYTSLCDSAQKYFFGRITQTVDGDTKLVKFYTESQVSKVMACPSFVVMMCGGYRCFLFSIDGICLWKSSGWVGDVMINGIANVPGYGWRLCMGKLFGDQKNRIML